MQTSIIFRGIHQLILGFFGYCPSLSTDPFATQLAQCLTYSLYSQCRLATSTRRCWCECREDCWGFDGGFKLHYFKFEKMFSKDVRTFCRLGSKMNGCIYTMSFSSLSFSHEVLALFWEGSWCQCARVNFFPSSQGESLTSLKLVQRQLRWID